MVAIAGRLVYSAHRHPAPSDVEEKFNCWKFSIAVYLAILYAVKRFMKPYILLGTILSATLLFSACDPKRKTRTEPAPKPEEKVKKPSDAAPRTSEPVLSPDDGGGEEKKKPDENVRIEPKPSDKIPPPPSDGGKEEYAVKMPGKPGFVTDPHDASGRPLDVRGMPPGTKIQSPFSGSVLLVPPQ